MTTQATFTATIFSSGGTTAGIEVPPAVIDELGGGRRPTVTVTLDGRYSYDYTIGVMGGRHLIGISNDHRRASGLAVGDEVRVELVPVDAPREVDVPAELASAIAAEPVAEAAWQKLAYSRRKEWARSVADAKAADTKARRVEKALSALRGE